MKTLPQRIRNCFEDQQIRLFFVLFGVALLARGGMFLRGFAVDDYSYGRGFSDFDRELIQTQGRFLLVALASAIDSLGVNLNDIYWSLAGVSLALQVALVMSVLRFAGIINRTGVGLAAALMVAHPYLAEILTFRMVLPGYCLAALLTIIAMEVLQNPRAGRYARFIISVIATVAMLFIYQGFLNYLAVALVFALLHDSLSKDAAATTARTLTAGQQRAVELLLVCIASAFGFLTIMTGLKHFDVIELTGRAKLVQFNEIPERILQFRELLFKVYWRAEPVAAQWPKLLIACMMAVSIVVIFIEGIRAPSSLRRKVILLGALVALMPLTAGVILLFRDWWPVPRVLVQASLIIGFVVLLGWSLLRERFPRMPSAFFTVPVLVLTVSFIFKNNQIFADQQRLNSWDAMKVNRIVDRLEKNPAFDQVKTVFISGGKWAYPARLSTIQGDLNISALYPGYTKLPLFIEVSGYNFKPAAGEQKTEGEQICKQVAPWPSAESVTVIGSLAIVCLGN
ncbi:glucosyltransferase domain-containing protein [Variovorax boronicumulans]|uniref:glucosyltransferase domain-containing protein n=1 Tax=Variovorax boronicumulans TaxID=436515 RepID=UPI0012E44204|nr:glucosyltransferase domain-containing protein [Variovorax boronicumulans]GER13365.1 hypothetical protein VHAB30_45500 [Variovorax boronicumulans]GER18975.1 hypothetical protein VCH24_40080 [Variovorax boronicumulans]